MKMREIINLIENQTVTSQMVTAAIYKTIEDFVGPNKQCKSIREIGDGSCFDFCQAVYKELGLEDDYYHEPDTGPLIKYATEYFWKDDFEADLKAIRKAGEIIPKGIRAKAIKEIMSHSTHEWIKFQGKYYDATAPEGVTHFLDLPYFKNQIDAEVKTLSQK